MIPDAVGTVLAADGVARRKFLLELAKALNAAGRVESLPKVLAEHLSVHGDEFAAVLIEFVSDAVRMRAGETYEDLQHLHKWSEKTLPTPSKTL